MRHAAEEAEGLHVPVAERLLGLGRIGHHKAGIRVRQVEREEVDLALRPADDADRLAEVGLGMARRVRQRHEHLPRPLPRAGDISFTMVMPPVKPCSSLSRSKIRFAVCCCFLGRPLSSARMRSMMAMKASSFGFTGGFVRR